MLAFKAYISHNIQDSAVVPPYFGLTSGLTIVNLSSYGRII